MTSFFGLKDKQRNLKSKKTCSSSEQENSSEISISSEDMLQLANNKERETSSLNQEDELYGFEKKQARAKEIKSLVKVQVKAQAIAQIEQRQRNALNEIEQTDILSNKLNKLIERNQQHQPKIQELSEDLAQGLSEVLSEKHQAFVKSSRAIKASIGDFGVELCSLDAQNSVEPTDKLSLQSTLDLKENQASQANQTSQSNQASQSAQYASAVHANQSSKASQTDTLKVGTPTLFDHKAFLKTVPKEPGIYRMYDKDGKVIYVGKAKELRKRLSSYFSRENDLKTRTLIANIAFIDFTVTFSETDALILENEFIKKYQPHYNILLRDNRSYPYLWLTTHQKHPGIYYFRGTKKDKGEFFGPFPDSSAVRSSLHQLKRLFPIRQCADSMYGHRSRPCLVAQIGMCLAPCVPLSKEQEDNYQEQVHLVRMFLKGQNQELLNEMAKRMMEHSDRLEFEEAARLRDQMTALRKVQESNNIMSDIDYPLDVIACAMYEGLVCVYVLFIRQGKILGSHAYFPKVQSYQALVQEVSDIEQSSIEGKAIYSFLTQFYLNEQQSSLLPKEVIIVHEHKISLEELALYNHANSQTQSNKEETSQLESNKQITESSQEDLPKLDSPKNITEHNDLKTSKEVQDIALSNIVEAKLTQKQIHLGLIKGLKQNDLQILQEAVEQQFKHKLRFVFKVRGMKARYAQMALKNAQVALQSKLVSLMSDKNKIETLEQVLHCPNIKRMECYDISHTFGENVVGSCVVFGRNGPQSSRYRRYNIENIVGGDDFAAMRQVLQRRFKDPDAGENPEIVFIDGGLGQLKQAEEVLAQAFSSAQKKIPLLVAVTKGEGRKVGLESLYLGFTHEKIKLELTHPALQLILYIRDESHRFAITAHRAKRSKTRVSSKLELIPGVGAKRRQAILKYFGGIQGVKGASVAELQKVPSISAELAQKIYDYLHA